MGRCGNTGRPGLPYAEGAACSMVSGRRRVFSAWSLNTRMAAQATGFKEAYTLMDAQTFCLYSLAAAGFVWGALGLRFAVSVLIANAVLAFLLYGLNTVISNENLLYTLMLSYPLYWGMAFAACKFFERPELPSMNVPLRLGLGCTAALVFVLCANWAPLARAGELFRITYLIEPKERAVRLAGFLHQSDDRQRCEDSYSDLMGLAFKARDKDVIEVFFQAFATCKGAASTVSDVVKPVIDNGDVAGVEFLLQCGLAPDTEVFGYDYANGVALAYAAVGANRPELVRMIFASAPETARHMKYLDNMLETLNEQGNKEMLSTLDELGIR